MHWHTIVFYVVDAQSCLDDRAPKNHSSDDGSAGGFRNDGDEDNAKGAQLTQKSRTNTLSEENRERHTILELKMAGLLMIVSRSNDLKLYHY